MKIKICIREGVTIPKVGDLISNSRRTPNYVNLVVEVTPLEDGTVSTRSVRYGHTNCGNFRFLEGVRSRGDIVFPNNQWRVVELFGLYDDSEQRSMRMHALEGVDTRYRKPEDEPK